MEHDSLCEISGALTKQPSYNSSPFRCEDSPDQGCTLAPDVGLITSAIVDAFLHDT